MEAAIIGATGYTGFELVKILLRHSKIKIKYVTSDTSAGKKYSDFTLTCGVFFDSPYQTMTMK